MNRQIAINTLQSHKATKDELRRALAFALDVEYRPEPIEKQESVFNHCKALFCAGYQTQSGLPYMFSAKDGKALKEIIGKIQGITTNATDQTITATFSVLIEKLPDWYKQNAFSLTVINSKFNEIVSSIKKYGKSASQSGVSDNYKQRLLDDLQA